MAAHYSILMSVYFREKPEYLHESIESMLNQTELTDDFVIVCDGKLTPELYDLLEEYDKKYAFFNILKYDENKGLGYALNHGLGFCKNEYVLRMDSDDISRNDRAAMQIKKLEEGYDIVGSDISEFENDKSNIFAYKNMPVEHEEIVRFSKKRDPFNHPSMAFRKSVILKAGGYQHLPYAEDYYLKIRAIQMGARCYNIPQYLVNMRSGKEMRKRRSGKKIRRSMQQLRKYMLKTHYINIFQYWYYSFCQIVLFILMPNSIRVLFFKKVLRGKKRKGR